MAELNCSRQGHREHRLYADPWEEPLLSSSTGDGYPGSTVPCEDEFGSGVTGWKCLRDCIALLVSQDWKNTDAKNAARTSWSQGLQMRSHCWSLLCWAPNLTLLFHLLLLFWAKKCSISFNSLHTVLRHKKISLINESPEMKCFFGIALSLLVFLYPPSEYIQPLWVFGLKSLATPTLSFSEEPPFSCMSYWTGIVGEQMETMCKSPALLLPELWARIKSCIWAAFWLWRWHRQEAV